MSWEVKQVPCRQLRPGHGPDWETGADLGVPKDDRPVDQIAQRGQTGAIDPPCGFAAPTVGTAQKIQGGTVWIRSYKESGDYVIEVEDNGIGFDSSNVGEKNRQNKSMGLENICFRIQEISGGSMEIFSRPGEGTKVVLRVPEKKTSYYGKEEDGHENNHSR